MPGSLRHHMQGEMPGAVEQPPRRPSLEYQYALNACTVAAYNTPGPVAILASSSLFENEFHYRLGDEKVAVYQVGRRDSILTSSLVTHTTAPNSYEMAIWAQPSTTTAGEIAAWLSDQLTSNGLLYLITSGWLARALPEWASPPHPAESPMGPRSMSALLPQFGFIVQSVFGFHGPRSILYGYAAHLMNFVRRDDLADRYRFKMREWYVSEGSGASLAPVSLIIAAKIA